MEESRLERKLKLEIEKRDGMALKFVSPGKAGVPDRILMLPEGVAVFVEVKAPGKKLRPLQQKRAIELERLGFPVETVSSDAEVEGLLEKLFPLEFIK
ncbi:VRR-NUC domain-containing protein [Halobacillus shinanisalinarum]|uniref:VRR-NUC domain-containing protein n=1 Tax=Halobacillus shinanisalinarum TaxID=2932258 RepID=A0ABY4GYX2_9BACI|nr:VRR-NUC domain-containing protein [Halobacillus shinanisalinarum]UOQ93400.1 VRR-NUC domain-containing protein [Halobacillus shinanisalinarum]